MKKLSRLAGMLIAVMVAAVLGSAQKSTRLVGDGEVAVTVGDYQPVVSFPAVSNEVLVNVRVLDRSGRAVAGLERSQFRLEDDGQQQAIDGFAAYPAPGPPEPVAPGTVAGVHTRTRPKTAVRTPVRQAGSVLLYFDDLNTAELPLVWARQEALAYLKHNGSGDPGRAVSFAVLTGSGIGSLGFTSSVAAVQKSLRRVSPHPRRDNFAACPKITPYQAWVILNVPESDAMRLAIAQSSRCGGGGEAYIRNLASDVLGAARIQSRLTFERLLDAIQLLASRTGLRTLVLTSSGFLVLELDMRGLQRQVIDAALRGHIVIDAVDAKGLEAPNPGGGAWNDPWINFRINGWRLAWDGGGFSPRDAPLSELAEATGGNFLHDSNGLRRAYARDVQAPEVYYTLSFSPKVKPDGRFHKLKVAVEALGRHYHVQARSGYIAAAAAPPGLPPPAQQKLIGVVMGAEAEAGIDSVLHTKATSTGIQLGLQINPKALALQPRAGRYRGKIIVIFALLTPSGQYILGRKAEVALQLTAASLKRISRPGKGLALSGVLPAPPGTYRVRTVLYEPATGAVTTFTERVSLKR